jgi:hypothetical protein
MFIPDPDFCPSRIPNPTTAAKDRKEKKLAQFTKNYRFYPGSGSGVKEGKAPDHCSYFFQVL